MSATDDPVLARFRAALDDAYRDRIERVVLFGSRAQGDAGPNSDDDVAIFLKDYQSFGLEIQPLDLIETDILFDTGVFISASPMPEGAYNA